MQERSAHRRDESIGLRKPPMLQRDEASEAPPGHAAKRHNRLGAKPWYGLLPLG